MNDKSGLIQRWDKLLQGLEENEKESCATLLQSQLEFNKPKGEDRQFARVSIPLAKRVFSGLQMEVSSAPLSRWEAVAKWPFSGQQDGRGFSLKWEAEQVAKLAEEVVDAIEKSNIAKIHNFRLTRGDEFYGTIEVNCE